MESSVSGAGSNSEQSPSGGQSRLLGWSTARLVLVFLVLDAIALFCYWLWTQDVLESRFYKLGRDRGLFEFIEYAKFGLIIWLLADAFRSSGQRVFRAWQILFIVMLVDNAAGLHEFFGEVLAEAFPIPAMGLERPKDVGEIIMLAVMEGTALLWVGWCYLSASAEGRRASHQLVALLGLFAFFGVVIDAMHMTLVEEVGELLVMTSIVGFLHFSYRRRYLQTRSDS